MKAVADKKKEQNIGEYIIYMYQMEDLLRAYQFNIKDVEAYVVSHYPIGAVQQNETLQWFANLAEEMKKEDILIQGHLSQTEHIVDQLASLHWQLLKTDRTYFDIYQNAKPFVIELIMESKSAPPRHEIQACLNGIYGLLLVRLGGKQVSENLLAATNAFGEVLSYLNIVYFMREGNKVREN
jgi:hypothetical protein